MRYLMLLGTEEKAIQWAIAQGLLTRISIARNAALEQNGVR